MLEAKRILVVDHATAWAQALGVAPTISREGGGQHHTFARASQNVAAMAMLLDTLLAPSTTEVDKLYH
jgi:hypothetical protein